MMSNDGGTNNVEGDSELFIVNSEAPTTSLDRSTDTPGGNLSGADGGGLDIAFSSRFVPYTTLLVGCQ